MELSDVQKERFWARVNKTDTCWLWTGCCAKKSGYGMLGLNQKMYFAHRVSWVLYDKIIPEGLEILHSCRSKNCVNPAHLSAGTHAQNMADMIRDGTLVNGENHPQAILTDEQVREIRARSTENRRILGEEYGVARNTISKIIHRKRWKHIT